MPCDTSALLAIRPGPLLDALRVLMSTIPHIILIQEAKDFPSMLDMVVKSHPALVLLDAGLSSAGDWSTIDRIKAVWPQAHCLVLVDTCQEKRAARAANADAVLIKGLPPAKVVETIERLLAGCGR